jgi:hypothetical protein
MIWILILCAVIGGCGGPSHMIRQDKTLDVREVKPLPGKSAIVVARMTKFGGAVEFEAYLDKKMFGVTKGLSCFMKNDVEPGLHYISARGENLDTLMMTLDPDKTYYVQHDVRMGFWKAAVSSGVSSAQQMGADTEGACNYYLYDTANPGPDMSEEDWTYARANARKPE